MEPGVAEFTFGVEKAEKADGGGRVEEQDIHDLYNPGGGTDNPVFLQTAQHIQQRVDNQADQQAAEKPGIGTGISVPHMAAEKEQYNQNAEGIDFKVGKRTHRLLLLLRDFFIISCRNLERNRKNA